MVALIDKDTKYIKTNAIHTHKWNIQTTMTTFLEKIFRRGGEVVGEYFRRFNGITQRFNGHYLLDDDGSPKHLGGGLERLDFAPIVTRITIYI